MKISIDITIDSKNWRNIGTNLRGYIKRVAKLTLSSIPQLTKLQSAELSIYLTEDKALHELNRLYRNQDKPTNVLSFPARVLDPKSDIFSLYVNSTIEQAFFLGDIALSYERIEFEAIHQQKSFIDHFTHLLVHGILHLLWYDHIEEEDQKVMEALEIEILKKFNIKDPY